LHVLIVYSTGDAAGLTSWICLGFSALFAALLIDIIL
jgi:hypothetical protein